jgi:hypothetical protein
MPPHPCRQATPHHRCQATTHPDLWHLLGQRLTWTIIVSFCLHLNPQKMARATQVTLEFPNIFHPVVIGLWVRCQKVSTIQHQEWCVARGLGGSISEMLPCTHKGCTVRVCRLCQIDWLHQHDLEVVHNDPFFCRQHNECYQNYVWLNPTFSLWWRWTTSYSNPGAQGE